MSNTVNRGWLRREIEKGNIEAKCTGHYTDDYADDAARGFRRTDWQPAKIGNPFIHHEGDPAMYFEAEDFRNFGRAWRNTDNTITLSFGYRAYTMRQRSTADTSA